MGIVKMDTGSIEIVSRDTDRKHVDRHLHYKNKLLT